MGNIAHWTIWNTPNKAADGPQYNVYIAGPDAGEWEGEGVEVVPAEQLRGAVEERDQARAEIDRLWAALEAAQAEVEQLRDINAALNPDSGG